MRAAWLEMRVTSQQADGFLRGCPGRTPTDPDSGTGFTTKTTEDPKENTKEFNKSLRDLLRVSRALRGESGLIRICASGALECFCKLHGACVFGDSLQE